jgi:hypothetical protein
MRCGVGYLVLAIVFALAAEACAQVLQLPSFSSFGVDTTVIVPDSGAARTGSVRRASSGTSSFGGIPRNRVLGTSAQAAGTHVRAQIHDPQAADDALLRQAQARRAGDFGNAPPAPRGGLARAAADPLAGSVVEMEQRRAEQAVAQQREAAALFEKGRRAQTAGKSSVAAVYYRMAAKQASGPLKKRIDAELSALPAGSARAVAPLPAELPSR